MFTIYALVIDSSGVVIARLGPFATAAVARGACTVEAGQTLVWTQRNQDWVAALGDREYRVPAEPSLDA
jgi:hypothetical protein